MQSEQTTKKRSVRSRFVALDASTGSGFSWFFVAEDGAAEVLDFASGSAGGFELFELALSVSPLFVGFDDSSSDVLVKKVSSSSSTAPRTMKISLHILHRILKDLPETLVRLTTYPMPQARQVIRHFSGFSESGTGLLGG